MGCGSTQGPAQKGGINLPGLEGQSQQTLAAAVEGGPPGGVQ